MIGCQFFEELKVSAAVVEQHSSERLSRELDLRTEEWARSLGKEHVQQRTGSFIQRLQLVVAPFCRWASDDSERLRRLGRAMILNS